eukprot:scaffold82841_cov63-Cyclotella_meneghiniana.AAC.7
MTLPTSCHVWVHEHHIHKILGLTSSKTHGQYHALSCVLTTIKNGKGGNKNKNTYLAVYPKYACCSFAPSSSNTHQIAFSEHGSLETFDAGELNLSGGVLQKPRWFRFGHSTCCELSTQLAIIAEAIGDMSVDMDDTTRNRRQGQFKNFFYERDDDGYSRSDIPFIAYKFYHQLHNVFKTDINMKFITTKKDGTVDISRRAFVGMELNNFEGLLRQMLAATTIHGKLRVSNGEWIFGMATREINISITPRPVQQSTVTPAARVSTDTRRQPPTIRRSDSNSSTGSNTIPDWLLLSQLNCVGDEHTLYLHKIRPLAESELLILRHIMFDSGLPLVQVMNLWALFYYLIMHRPIPSDSIASQTSIWNHIHRLYYIDNILESRKFHKFISIPTPNNFRRYFYSSSDASQHHDHNRVVVNISTNSSPDPVKIEPSFRNITNSVTAVKTGEFMATKNMEALVKELGTEAVSHYGGGTNDNAPDAQKEIRLMFDSMMKLLQESDNDNIRELMYINGVLRRVIAFGDPFHIANLAVTWAKQEDIDPNNEVDDTNEDDFDEDDDLRYLIA